MNELLSIYGNSSNEVLMMVVYIRDTYIRSSVKINFRWYFPKTSVTFQWNVISQTYKCIRHMFQLSRFEGDTTVFLSAFFLLFAFCWICFLLILIIDGPVCPMKFGSKKLPVITSSFGSAYFSLTSFLYFF